jgi:hypothetical protein
MSSKQCNCIELSHSVIFPSEAFVYPLWLTMDYSKEIHVFLPFYQSNKAAGQGLGGFGGQAAAAPEADGDEEPAVLSPSVVNTQESGTSGKAVPSGKENAPGRQRKGREYRKSDLEVIESSLTCTFPV